MTNTDGADGEGPTLTPAEIARLLALAQAMRDRLEASLASVDLAAIQRAATEQIAPSALAAAKAASEMWERERPTVIKQLEASLTPILEGMRRLADDIRLHAPAIADWTMRVVPPNLVRVPGLQIEEASGWMAEEGLPIAWVLDPMTVEHVAASTNAEERFAAVVTRRQHILNYVREQFAEIDDSELTYLVEKVTRAIRLLELEENEGAQALAGNLLDTAFRLRHPVRRERTDLVRRDDREPDDLSLVDYFFVAQLWGAYESYYSGPIPTRFNRHATAHAVSPEQYTPANALVGVLHAASAVLLVAQQRRPRTSDR